MRFVRLLVTAAEGLQEEGSSQTQLQEMVQFFYKNKTSDSGTSLVDFNQLEMQVESLSSHVETLRETNGEKKHSLNILANKYELIKSEFELYKLELEENKKLKEEKLACTLLIEAKANKSLQEDWDRLEMEALENLMREKRRKLHKEEVKAFKKQFKEMVCDYEIVDFKRSEDTGPLKECEEMWKRLMMEYTSSLDQNIKAIIFAPTTGQADSNEQKIIQQQTAKVGVS
jgi:hypothetical protein